VSSVVAPVAVQYCDGLLWHLLTASVHFS